MGPAEPAPALRAYNPPAVYRGKGCTSAHNGAAPILTTSALPASLTAHTQASLRRTLTRALAPGEVRAYGRRRSADESVHGRRNQAEGARGLHPRVAG